MNHKKKHFNGVISSSILPYLDQHDGEYVCNLYPDTYFYFKPHFVDNQFFCYNIYAVCPYELKEFLLESFDTVTEVVDFIHELEHYDFDPEDEYEIFEYDSEDEYEDDEDDMQETL